MPDGGSGNRDGCGKDSNNGKNSGGDDGGCGDCGGGGRVGGSIGDNDRSNNCHYYGGNCDGGGDSDSNSG